MRSDSDARSFRSCAVDCRGSFRAERRASRCGPGSVARCAALRPASRQNKLERARVDSWLTMGCPSTGTRESLRAERLSNTAESATQASVWSRTREPGHPMRGAPARREQAVPSARGPSGPRTQPPWTSLMSPPGSESGGASELDPAGVAMEGELRGTRTDTAEAAAPEESDLCMADQPAAVLAPVPLEVQGASAESRTLRAVDQHSVEKVN
jgi:hypothetical protein